VDASFDLANPALYSRRSGLVVYDGFSVLKESLTRSRKQLTAIKALAPIQKQFVGTMIDTEIAAGYFLRTSNVSGSNWSAYVAVKTKYKGDLTHMASLIGRQPPSRGWYANTIKHSLDRRWSLNIQGVVAYALLREARPYLHNEKSIVEVDCILEHGPIVSGRLPHPFVQSGAKRLKRGVWYWPSIDDENDRDPRPTVDK
jgi:hypothetical protein